MAYRILRIGEYEVPIGSHHGKRIIIGSDHRGYELKEKLHDYLRENNWPVTDVGCRSPERCDFPVISDALGDFIQVTYRNVGIGICGSGNGILIAAGRKNLVIPARALTVEEAIDARTHLNSNLLGLAADGVKDRTTFENVIGIVNAFLDTEFYSDPENDNPYLQRYLHNIGAINK